MMNKDLDKLKTNIKGRLKYDYSVKNHTWLNIGGNAKIFFVPETLAELRDFLLCMKKDNKNFFCHRRRLKFISFRKYSKTNFYKTR